MASMTRTSYLRVYQPLSEIGGRSEDHERWLSGEDEEPGENTTTRRWLLRWDLPSLDIAGPPDGAFVRKVGDTVMVCPWRTRLRMLAGLLAFRGSVPDEVAEAFVPEDDAQRAAHELARLEEDHPEVRNHIIHANWHVPLRWFVAFDDSERILTEDRFGLRVRYETSLEDARGRLTRALKVLETSWIDEAVTATLRELLGWLGEFTDEGLLELDYGSVSALFDDDELVEDRSSSEVWTCLEALEAGDVITAGRIFNDLTERWTEIRALEVVN